VLRQLALIHTEHPPRTEDLLARQRHFPLLSLTPGPSAAPRPAPSPRYWVARPILHATSRYEAQCSRDLRQSRKSRDQTASDNPSSQSKS
jgi:hypothetical protein